MTKVKTTYETGKTSESTGNNILFVCSQNTCRSPMAEYLLRHMAKNEGLDVKVESRAGANFIFGCLSRYYFGNGRDSAYKSKKERLYADSMTHLAVEALLQYDPKIEGVKNHKAKVLTIEDVANADLVLTMSGDKREEIIRHTQLAQKHDANLVIKANIFTLREYAQLGGLDSISDPMLMSLHIPDYVYNIFGGEFNDDAFENYTKCRDEIIECLNVLVKDLKDPAKMQEKIKQLESDRATSKFLGFKVRNLTKGDLYE